MMWGARVLRVRSVSREEIWASAGVQGAWVGGCGWVSCFNRGVWIWYRVYDTSVTPEKPTKAAPVHPPPAIGTRSGFELLKGHPMRPSQAPSASSSCRNFVVVGNKGLKSKAPCISSISCSTGPAPYWQFHPKEPQNKVLPSNWNFKGLSHSLGVDPLIKFIVS